MNDIEKLVDEVINQKNKTITDEVFLLIQNNRNFMQKYLKLIQKHGVNTVNPNIGKMVKAKYGLTNKKERNKKPQSTLIVTSHQEF